MRLCAAFAITIMSVAATACARIEVSQSTAVRGRVIDVNALQADVDVLEQAYDELHPGLLRYNSSQQMRQHFQSLRRQLDHDQSLAEAYVAFSQFAATIRCGHTYTNFYNQPKLIQKTLFENADRLPLYFVWLDGKMIVTQNFSADARIGPGDEVLRINGVSTHAILDRLMSVARADGDNDGKRVAYLQVQGNDRYEAFDIFFPLLFPPKQASFDLDVRSMSGTTYRARVEPLSFAQRLAARPQQTEAGQVWSLRYPLADAAVLTMPTWAMYNNAWDWKAYLDGVFRQLVDRHIQKLVIDLRANEGGDDVGNVILQHLIERPITLPRYDRRVRYRKVPDSLMPYLDTWDASFFDWGNDAQPISNGFFLLTKYDDGTGDVLQPAAPQFHGQVIVLTGPTNSSATFQFIQAAHEAKLATLIGETTGGNLRGINGGAFFFLRLPHSGIELDVPLIGRFSDQVQANSGVAPDIVARQTPKAIADHRDIALEAALAEKGKSAPHGASL